MQNLIYLGNVYYTRRSAYIATGIVLVTIGPIILCIVCALYWYRRRAIESDPDWKPSLPRSRSGSRTNLRHLNSDNSEADSDTLQKSESYSGVYRTHEPLKGKPNIEFPEKKWDLEEEDLDITSSDGGASELPQGRIAKDITYIPGTNVDDQPRQFGRRGMQPQQQTPGPQEPLSSESPSSYSPSYEHSAVQSRPPSGSVRVLPNKFFTDRSPVYDQSPSPILTQTVGLPSPPLNNRSTEV